MPDKVRQTLRSSSQKMSEPVNMSSQGEGWHGGRPWFREGVDPGRVPAGVRRELFSRRGGRVASAESFAGWLAAAVDRSWAFVAGKQRLHFGTASLIHMPVPI